MKFHIECDECDGLILLDKNNLEKLNDEILYEMDILLDFSGKTELVYDFPNEKWQDVRKRESKHIKNFCNNGEMIIWLLDGCDKECEIQFVEEIKETSKWLHITSGKILAVTASELIQCISYPELEMEKIFEIDVQNGWYAVSAAGIDEIKLSCKIQPVPPFENIQEF